MVRYKTTTFCVEKQYLNILPIKYIICPHLEVVGGRRVSFFAGNVFIHI